MNKRVPKDIAMAMDGSLAAEGIYYSAKDDDLTRGYAMIVGPEDTPYAGGLFFFRFFLPTQYPFEPPKVEFCTYDGTTRFHPNLYREGKVCLSILGTWSGPGWVSTMNITTVLLTIQSLLHANPITCEPSYEKLAATDPRSVEYSGFIQHRVVQYTLGAYRGIGLGEFASIFQEAMVCVRPVVFDRLRKVINKNKGVIKTYRGLVYSLAGVCDWGVLEDQFTAGQPPS